MHFSVSFMSDFNVCTFDLLFRKRLLFIHHIILSTFRFEVLFCPGGWSAGVIVQFTNVGLGHLLLRCVVLSHWAFHFNGHFCSRCTPGRRVLISDRLLQATLICERERGEKRRRERNICLVKLVNSRKSCSEGVIISIPPLVMVITTREWEFWEVYISVSARPPPSLPPSSSSPLSGDFHPYIPLSPS